MAKKKTKQQAGQVPPSPAADKPPVGEVLQRMVTDLFTCGDRTVKRLGLLPDEETMHAGWAQQPVLDRVAEAYVRQRSQDMFQLSATVQQVLQLRGWRTGWEARMAHMTLETSELVEAIRDKRPGGLDGVRAEAGDVVIGLVALLNLRGLSLLDAIQAAELRLISLAGEPGYAGEETEREVT